NAIVKTDTMHHPSVPSQEEHNDSNYSSLSYSFTNVSVRTHPLHALGNDSLLSSIPSSSFVVTPSSHSSQRRTNPLSMQPQDIDGSYNQRKCDSVSSHQQTTSTIPAPIFPGLGIVYSVSGFDVIGLLARVATRPNPQINLGPVDLECSIIV
ncbi:7310_t:CDS:2, partial [Ambispora leptoticha]